MKIVAEQLIEPVMEVDDPIEIVKCWKVKWMG